MTSRWSVVVGSFALLPCLLCRPCLGDTEGYTTPWYGPSNEHYMYVQAVVSSPSNNQQFWGSGATFIVCYSIPEYGSYTWGAYDVLGNSHEHACWGSADSFQNGGSHYLSVDSTPPSGELTYFMPSGGQWTTNTSYYDHTDDYAGSSMPSYGGIWYYLDAVTSEYDDTYYPGFGASVGAREWFNCACNC